MILSVCYHEGDIVMVSQVVNVLLSAKDAESAGEAGEDEIAITPTPQSTQTTLANLNMP
jgi:hypothetical protein